jgi:phosphatidylinositol alpha-1,6-mannosyltransferase
MKILLLTTDAFGAYGGIAQYNRDLLLSLCMLPDVTSVTAIPLTLSHPIGDLPPKLKYVTHGAKSKLLYPIFALRAILSKPDIIVCGHINLLSLCLLIKVFTRAPLILLVYGVDVWQKPLRLFHSRFLKKIAQIWSISLFTQKKMQAWSKAPEKLFRIVPNAIHLEKYGLATKDIKLVEKLGLKNKKVIVMMGRLATIERWKGIDEVLNVLPNILSKEPNLVLVIIGDGDDKPRLEKRVKKLGLTENVIFTGYVSDERKSAFLHLADAFVMPTRAEGFGFVFLEALASGIPVVASKIDGSREALMGGKLGRLVDPDKPDELEAEALAALSDPHQISSDLQYFSFDTFKNRVSKLLKEVSGSHINILH